MPKAITYIFDLGCKKSGTNLIAALHADVRVERQSSFAEIDVKSGCSCSN